MNRYKPKASVELITQFPAFCSLLFRDAALAALRKELLQTEETAMRLEMLFQSPYGYDAEMLFFVRGFLKDLFDLFHSSKDAQTAWREHAAEFIGRPWPADELRSAAQAIPIATWIAHRERQSPRSAAGELCDALLHATHQRLQQAAECGNRAHRRAYAERNIPIWITAHAFLSALFKGFHKQYPTRREWHQSPYGRRWRPWSGPIMLSHALKVLMAPDLPRCHGGPGLPPPPFE